MNAHLLRFDKSKEIGILDFETFNLCLSFVNNRPWQAGLMIMKGDEIIDSNNIHIKWPDCDLRISDRAREVTKFNDRVFEEKAIPEEQAFLKIYEFSESCEKIIIHNGLGFDIYLLRDWYKKHRKPWSHLVNKIIDTNAIARGIKLEMPFVYGDNLLEYQYRAITKKKKGVKTSLTSLGKEFNIAFDYDNLHDAINDIKLNRLVWNVLKFKIEI